MSDSSTPSPDQSGGTSRGVIAVAALAAIAVVAVIVFVVVGGDDDETAETTVPAETTVLPSTTAPVTTVPATTVPATTVPATVPPTAPPTTVPPTAPPTTVPPTTVPAELGFTIADIDDGGTIPTEFTCDGDDTPPVITVESVPGGTAQLALIVDDPDAPTPDPFVHWLVYGIPADATEITDGNGAFTYGANDFANEAWSGPCPPEGDGPHGYEFTLYALDSELGLEPGLDGRQVEEAIAGSTIAEELITATYERAG